MPVRPHFTLISGRWHCFSPGHFGIGDTQRAAYTRWYVSHFPGF